MRLDSWIVMSGQRSRRFGCEWQKSITGVARQQAQA